MAATGAGFCCYFLVGKLAFLLLLIAPVLISGVCRFGNDCVFPCHCQNHETCNEVTGVCESGCEKYINSESGAAPFSGPGCQIKNLAHSRGVHASQVGTWGSMVASRAVDGDIRQEEAYCSQPEASPDHEGAWWQVDLGDVYVINRVIIVNGYQTGENNFLHNIYISIGNSSNVMNHSGCGEQTDKVPAETNVTISCEGWGSRISIRKFGGHKMNTLLFCEVFVIGYKYIDCAGACSGTCDKVIGCDKCQVGKKMPNCKLDCDPGTHGINCAERCSEHCVHSSRCDHVTGSCSGGCQQWYGLDTCMAEIIKVDYESTPTTFIVTSSSMSVSWPQSTKIPPRLESHYQYVVETADGQSNKEVRRPFIAGQASQTADIKGLTYNTQYLIKVRIDATHNNRTSKGNAGSDLSVKTSCIPPAKPVAPNVAVLDLDDSGLGSLQVTWQNLGDSGCDNFKKVVVQYKLTSSGEWQDKMVRMSQTQLTIDNLQPGYFDVRLSVTNNEDMGNVSESTTSNVNDVVTTTRTGETSSSSNSSSIIIGVVVALVVLIIIVIVVVFRMRNGGKICERTDNTPTFREVEDAIFPAHEPLPVYAARRQEPVGQEQEEEEEEEEVGHRVAVPDEAIYQNLVHVSTMVPVNKLEAYIKERVSIEDGFVPEYNNLPSINLDKVNDANTQSNICKNRFKNIWPYDDNRVKLTADDDSQSDYINASYITDYKDKPKTYVACQGPRQNTINDMWRMIWQLKINRIVMVTQLSENGKRKCDIYWPLTIGAPKVYGKVVVTMLSCDVYADFTIRTFDLKYEDASHKVTHFQYTSWVDKGVPKDTHPLLTLRRLIRSHDSSGPMVVHCSAGIGRTGTFIALDSLLDQAEEEGQVDVFTFVKNMRAERMEMVQTQIQYVFIYHALLDGVKTGHFAYPVSQYPTIYKRLCEEDSNLTELSQQIKLLDDMKPKPPGPSSAALLKMNSNKNRSLDIIPSDNNRPYLISRSPGTNDYINAVYVNSYRRRNSFLLTEVPQTNTVIDLWRLVLDHQCPTIIMLDEEKEGEAYWPDEDDPEKTHGKLTVKLLNERYTSIANVVERELTVYLTATPGNSHKVKHYLLTSGWPRGCDVPTDTNAFMNLVELANRPVSEEGSGPTILQCLNGASCCGLFCVATHLLGSMSMDKYVDIFHSTKHVQSKRRQVVSNLEQFKFLHKLVMDYQEQHATYMNI